MWRLLQLLGPTVLALALMSHKEAMGVNITLGFTTDMRDGNYFPVAAIQIALDAIRSRGALQRHSFRYAII